MAQQGALIGCFYCAPTSEMTRERVESCRPPCTLTRKGPSLGSRSPVATVAAWATMFS